MNVRAACCSAMLVVCGVLGYEKFVSTQTQPPASYFIVDVGTLGGATSSAFGLAESADTVGSSLRADGTSHAFLASGRTIRDLGTLGGVSSVATDANRRGAVVGHSLNAAGEQKAFLYTAADGMVSLGTLGGTASAALAVSDTGEIVGTAQRAGNAARRAFVYQNGAMTELGLASFGGTDSAATAISDFGPIAGWASTAGNASTRAFLYDLGVTTNLGTLGGASVATGVNGAIHVVGYSEVAPGGAKHAFLYSDGSMKDLGTLGGTNSEATAINDWSHIVGFSELSGGAGTRAFLYANGAMVDLNTRLPSGSGWILEAATAINGSGEIAGYGQFNGQRRAFRLMPPVRIEVRHSGALSQQDSNLPRDGVQAGRLVTFVSSVLVSEDGSARNVVFTDTLSGPLEIVNVHTYRELEPCVVEGQTVTCNVAGLGPYGFFEEELWVTARVTGAGAFSHVARATADNVLPDDNDSVREENVGLALAGFTLSATTIAGGKAVLAEATLTDLPNPGGSVVRIATSDPALAPVPSRLVVQRPTNWRNFNIIPPVVSQPTTATISATFGLVTISRTLTVVPPALNTLSLSRSTIIGSCQTASGKVTLTGSAPSSGATVSLATTTTGAKTPATVVVPAGAMSATFTVTTNAVPTLNKGTFTASYGGASKTLSLSVRPIYLTAVAVTPSTIVGGGTASGQATIECAAPPGGTTISLASTNSAVATPATSTIVIAAGGKTGAFSVKTKQPPATTSLSIRVTANGVTKSAPLTVTR
jgi:probable HAF family extracellular repeat protein